MAETITLTYDEILRQTDGAILFSFGHREQCIPKSLITDPDDLEDDGGEVEVQEWFVLKEGLEDFEI